MSEPRTQDTQPGAGVLRMTERIAAPRETVFDFLVDPEKMVRWMGTEADLDATPGGRFEINVTGSDIASGTYLEIDPPERVVFTWGWKGSADVSPGSSTVTVTLTADGEETILDLHHAGLPGGADDAHQTGWTYFLDRLATVSAGGDPGPSTAGVSQ